MSGSCCLQVETLFSQGAKQMIVLSIDCAIRTMPVQAKTEISSYLDQPMMVDLILGCRTLFGMRKAA